MNCGTGSVGTLEAVLTSVVLTSSFVGLLYLPFNVGNRNDPRIVRSRLVTLSLLAAISEFYIRVRDPEVISLASSRSVPSFLVAFILTTLLYFGHLAAISLRESLACAYVGWLGLRNYVFAPLLEEIVFRRHSLLLWRCLPQEMRIIGPAALFSIAHAHHALHVPVPQVIAQLVYTLMFGVYAASLFVATNSLVPALTAHIMCNFLGLPNIEAIVRHPWRRAIVVGYIVAVALFVTLFSPMLRIVAPSAGSAVL